LRQAVNPSLWKFQGPDWIVWLPASRLIILSGSIDLLCYPSLDSPAVSAALLDDEKGTTSLANPSAPFRGVVEMARVRSRRK
jgi:hypothetical protein